MEYPTYIGKTQAGKSTIPSQLERQRIADDLIWKSYFFFRPPSRWTRFKRKCRKILHA